MCTTTMASPYLGSFPKWYFCVEKEITASALFLFKYVNMSNDNTDSIRVVLQVMFICNHCPFVKHLKKDIVKLANFYMKVFDNISQLLPFPVALGT